MRMKTIALASAFALASTIAFAQTSSTGGSAQPGTQAPQATDNMKNSTTGRSGPSPKDASTQGAGTAGAVDKKGDAASPGGTMKK